MNYKIHHRILVIECGFNLMIFIYTFEIFFTEKYSWDLKS